MKKAKIYSIENSTRVLKMFIIYLLLLFIIVVDVAASEHW